MWLSTTLLSTVTVVVKLLRYGYSLIGGHVSGRLDKSRSVKAGLFLLCVVPRRKRLRIVEIVFIKR